MGINGFFEGEYGRPRCDFDDDRSMLLAVWIIMEIRGEEGVLEALDAVDRVRSGTCSTLEGDTEYMETLYTPEELVLVDIDGEIQSYPLREAEDAILKFWAFLLNRPPNGEIRRLYRPDLAEAGAALHMWERRFEREHPRRGRLDGLPSTGYS